VLDAAERLLVVDASGERQRSEIGLSGLSLWRRAAAIEQSGVEVVICGAVTRPLLEALRGAGVQVVPWVSGPVEEILRAYARGELVQDAFGMPGCGRRMRRGGGRRRGPGRAGRPGGGRGRRR